MKSFLLTIPFFLLIQTFILAEGCIGGNCLNGSGTYEFLDGSTYTGLFFDGLPHGKGTYNFVNGDTYTGNYKLGKIYGVGKMVYQNGSSYEGEWIYGIKEGKGTFTYKSGDSYIGHYLQDERDGLGKYFWHNGEQYEGLWENDTMNGIGARYYENKTKFEGQFTDGVPDGLGMLSDAQGKVLKCGLWANGEFSDAKEEQLVTATLHEQKEEQELDEFGVEEIYETNVDAIVSVITKDSSDEIISRGSGIIISQEGHILLPSYLWINGSSNSLNLYIEDSLYAVDTLITVNRVLEYAIVKSNKSTPCNSVTISKNELKSDEHLYVINSTIGLHKTLLVGKSTGIFSDEAFYYSDSQTKKRMNGGGLFNEKGELIGMLSLNRNLPDKVSALKINVVNLDFLTPEKGQQATTK